MAERVEYSSESNEWYTPEPIIDRVRATLGSIELDPASCPPAQETVQANRYFGVGGEVGDGLSVEWHANTLFVNPPYGFDENHRSNTKKWTEYLFDQWAKGNIGEAVLLTYAHPSRQWFYPFWNFPIAFLYKRIKFNRSDGSQGTSPPHCNAITYLPDGTDPTFSTFYEAWNEIGHIVDPTRQGGRIPQDYQTRDFL